MILFSHIRHSWFTSICTAYDFAGASKYFYDTDRIGRLQSTSKDSDPQLVSQYISEVLQMPYAFIIYDSIYIWYVTVQSCGDSNLNIGTWQYFK